MQFAGSSCCPFRVSLEHARGMPRGSDYYRDKERGYNFPPRRRGGGRGGDK